MRLGVEHALVYQAIEGSDEAPLDGNSSLVRVGDGETEDLRVPPESVGLPRTTRAQISWTNAEDEARRVLAALEGGDGPVKALILYNAALRLWMVDEVASVVAGVEKAGEAVRFGAAVELLGRLSHPTVPENAMEALHQDSAGMGHQIDAKSPASTTRGTIL